MNSDFQFCCARHLGNSVVVALQELVASRTPCERIRRIRVALIMLLICSRHVTCTQVVVILVLPVGTHLLCAWVAH